MGDRRPDEKGSGRRTLLALVALVVVVVASRRPRDVGRLLAATPSRAEPTVNLRLVRFARVIGAIGRVLVTAGVLILLFVAYQLWGTNVQTSRAQDELSAELEDRLAEAERSTTTARPTTTTAATEGSGTTRPTLPPVTAPPAPPPAVGEAVGRIEIPAIGLDAVFVEGVRVGDLKKGPGHYPGMPLPGQAGNVGVAGHRTTYGAPFNRIDELVAGDEITVTTTQGDFSYEVREQLIVGPRQNEVLFQTPDNRLTLTSCHPEFSARQRIIVVAGLQGEPVPTPPPRDEVDGADPELGLDVSGEPAPRLPAIVWGLVGAAIWLAASLVAKRWRKWPAYLIAAPIFLVALFFFFENFSRLLPANY
ncbi:MAG: class E sortase [Acidimicrobiales bacterium]